MLLLTVASVRTQLEITRPHDIPNFFRLLSLAGYLYVADEDLVVTLSSTCARWKSSRIFAPALLNPFERGLPTHALHFSNIYPLSFQAIQNIYFSVASKIH
jgi:hypothetical protein